MRRARHRGVTLLEVMISMTVLAVGLLGMMNLQVLAITSNQGARAQMQAMELARELAAGLARIPYDDPRLSVTTPFGSLLDPADAAAAHQYPGGTEMKGVRSEAHAAMLGHYARRWTVLDMDGAKVIAVSVIYRERTILAPREVVVYVGARKPGNVQAAALN